MADTTFTATTAPVVTRGLFAGNVLPLLMFLLFAVLPLFATFAAESYVLGLVTRVMIFAIAALALDLLIGYGALISFGHAAFFGVGAYTSTIMLVHYGVTPWIGMWCGALLAAV